MNNTLKKVLSYIGVAFASSIVTLGAVIGISSCASQQDHKADAATETQYRVYKYDLFGTNLYGSGVDQYFTLTGMNAGLSSFDYIYYFTGVYENENYQADGLKYYDRMAFTMDVVNNNSGNSYSSLIMSKLAISDGSTWIVLYDMDNNVAFNHAYSVFKAYSMADYGFTTSSNVVVTEGRPHAFIDFFSYQLPIYGNPTFSFKFLVNFNYNSFDQESNTQYTAKSLYPISTNYVTGTPPDNAYYYYDMPFFISNGMMFNRIVATFKYANEYVRFEMSDGTYKDLHDSTTFGHEAYFYSLSYVNTYNDLSVTVCNRTYYYTGDIRYVQFTPIWADSNFMTLDFYGNLENTLSRYVLTGSTDNVAYSISSIGYNNEVGLGSVFTLLTNTFQSFIPLMSIQIIPGITIGLLLFMPLIAGIIILIIWIVKR